MNPSESPFVIADLVARRGDFTLDVPALSAGVGTVIGLVGRNGAGKSTLLQVLAGLHRCDRGTVRVFGLDPWKDGDRVRLRTGWMSDDMPIWALRIDELLRALRGFYPTWDDALVSSLLDRLELDPRRRVQTLSKGEHTRIRLLITLAFKPDLVLLDEPATGLDVPARRALLELILGVVRDGTRTVVISSHQVDDIERIADRVLLIERGRITADGTASEVAGSSPNLEERLAAHASTPHSIHSGRVS